MLRRPQPPQSIETQRVLRPNAGADASLRRVASYAQLHAQTSWQRSHQCSPQGCCKCRVGDSFGANARVTATSATASHNRVCDSAPNAQASVQFRNSPPPGRSRKRDLRRSAGRAILYRIGGQKVRRNGAATMTRLCTYSNGPTAAFDAVEHIRKHLGDVEFTNNTDKFRKYTQCTTFILACAHVGVYGYPVKAWYELIFGQDTWKDMQVGVFQ